MLKRVAITGPESTGKSWLAEQLAIRFRTEFVPEYAREYLQDHGMNYDLKDIEIMAKGQVKNEEIAALQTKTLLFCDTDLLVPKIWSEVVFGSCSEWIQNQFLTHKYDLFLLCYPDLPWEFDPMRENPDNRDELFVLYEKALKENNFPYRIVKGLGGDRLENAINFVKEII
ncbi:MAG: ATP-binding protein [Bacteroidales bacterium]|nr:ATP-binding protein [Bacteroidales bacterium]